MPSHYIKSKGNTTVRYRSPLLFILSSGGVKNFLFFSFFSFGVKLLKGYLVIVKGSSNDIVQLPESVNFLKEGVPEIFSSTLKMKQLSETHLSNVVSILSDLRNLSCSLGTTPDYYEADIVMSCDYSSFGVALENRSWNPGAYRYGFNGKEKDPEGLGGGGATYDYGFRIYNPNLGKFLSVDPLTYSYPWYTPYQFAGNTPIACDDLDGLEERLTIWDAFVGGGISLVPEITAASASGTGSATAAISTTAGSTVTAAVGGAFLTFVSVLIPQTAHAPSPNATFNPNLVPYNDKAFRPITSDPSSLDDIFLKQSNQRVQQGTADATDWLYNQEYTTRQSRKTVAKDFFKKQGIPLKDLSGIDYKSEVKTLILKGGTILWQYREKGNTEPSGNWYTTPGTSARELGLPESYTELFKITLSKDVEALVSSAGDVQDWTVTYPKVLKGGGVQITSGEIKDVSTYEKIDP